MALQTVFLTKPISEKKIYKELQKSFYNEVDIVEPSGLIVLKDTSCIFFELVATKEPMARTQLVVDLAINHNQSPYAGWAGGKWFSSYSSCTVIRLTIQSAVCSSQP